MVCFLQNNKRWFLYIVLSIILNISIAFAVASNFSKNKIKVVKKTLQINLIALAAPVVKIKPPPLVVKKKTTY